nr:hypothetical protein [Tanacetum cinerariifolium]
DSSGDDVDDDEEEEEEDLASTDSVIVIPTDELVSPPEGTDPVIPPPSTDTTTTGARIIVRLQAAISFPPEVEVERLLAMPTPSPSPSPLTSLSPPSVGEHLARPTRDRGIDYKFVSTLDTEARRRGLGEVNAMVTKLVELYEHDAQDLYALLKDAQDSRTRISQRVTMDSQRVDLLMEDRIAHQETIHIVEEEAYDDELSAQREQPRRARQPGGDARVPDHQDALRDVDSYILGYMLFLLLGHCTGMLSIMGSSPLA